MKKLLIQITLIVFMLSGSSCGNSPSSIDLNDIVKHRQYQSNEIEKGKNFDEKFDIVRKLIAQYRAIELKGDSRHLNYYIGRLYSWFVFDKMSIDSLWYDPVKSEMKNNLLYKSFVDSAFYFIDLSLKDDSTNVFALTKYIDNTMNAAQLPLTIKGLYKYFDEHYKELNERVNNIFPFTDKILKYDTTGDKNLSFTALNHSFGAIELTLSETKNIDVTNDNTKNLFLILDDFVKRFNKIKHLLPNTNFENYLSKLHDKYKDYIAEANVTFEEYENLGCTKLWIYSNGKYKQELYEMDIESIPYDERMRLTAYDLKNCSYPGAKVYITRKSEGTYKVVGNYYYFYAKSGSPDILAGFDSEKGLYYLRKDSYGNFVWVNPVTFEDMSYKKVR